MDATTPLADNLAAARDTTTGRDAMNTLAQSFAQSEDFVRDASSLNLPLDQLADVLEAVDPSEEDWNPADLVERSLGSPVAAVIESNDFRTDVGRLQDSLLAMKIVPTEQGNAAMLLRLLGAADAIRRIASGVEDVGGSVRRLVLLPASIFPLPARRATPAVPPAEQQPEQTEDELLTRAGALDDALHELSAFAALAAAAIPPAPSTKAPADDRIVYPRIERERAETEVRVNAPPSRVSSLVLDAAAVSRLSPGVRETLADLKLDPTVTPLPSILHILETELGQTESRLK